MTRLLLFGIIILSTFLSSCNSDPQETTLEVNFTLTYEGQPLIAFDELNYPLGYKVFFTKYSLFLSDIALHSDGADYILSAVEFIDLLTGVGDVASARAGKTLTYLNVPSGSYNAVSFNIGVPASVNATAPANYDVNNPLSNNGEYWVGWTSYIFHKIEGKMDTDGDDDPEAGIALHIGSDQAFRTARINAAINLNEELETININFDLADILNLDGNYYDFLATPQIHHIGVLPKALPILDNTVRNISVTEL